MGKRMTFGKGFEGFKFVKEDAEQLAGFLKMEEITTDGEFLVLVEDEGTLWKLECTKCSYDGMATVVSALRLPRSATVDTAFTCSVLGEDRYFDWE